MLNAPLPGREQEVAKPGSITAEMEGESFMAAMAMMQGQG